MTLIEALIEIISIIRLGCMHTNGKKKDNLKKACFWVKSKNKQAKVKKKN